MTGFSDFNHGAFNELAQQLRNNGHIVWNPAEAFNGDTSHSWEDYMSVCIRACIDSDTVVVLPGWEASVGARLEVAIALACGIEVEHIKDNAPANNRDVVADLLGMTQVRR